MIVVCDTNVFVRDTHLLRKKGGPELLQFLRAIKGRLFVPEILHREYREQTVVVVSEERSKAITALSAIRTLVGRHHGPPLPDDQAAEREALARMLELEALTMTAPMSDELLAAAGTRSLQKRPPTSKSDHGYKDCLIWESILRLPPGSQVRLISRDKKAFYDGDQFSRMLTEEAEARQISVVGYLSLEPLLDELQRQNPQLDLSAFSVSDASEKPVDGTAFADAAGHVPSPDGTPFATGPAALAEADGPAAALDNLKLRLAEAQESFESLDLKLLGFISYLSTPGKEQLFRLLAQAGMPLDAARNVIDRLVITGFVRDTGTHYIVTDRHVSDLAASTVEANIIVLLDRDSRENG